MYQCMYICIYTLYVHTCICMYVCMCVYEHVDVHVCACVYVYALNMYVYVCMYVYVRMCIYIPYRNMSKRYDSCYLYLSIYLSKDWASVDLESLLMYVCVCSQLWRRACIQTCIYTYICIGNT